MRRNNKVNSRKEKNIAKIKYSERQIDKWIKWCVNIKGGIKYEQLKKKQDEYGIKCFSWRRTRK